MSSLKKQAEDLGIEIDGRWNDETLKQKIDEARAGKQTAPMPAPGEARIVPDMGGVRVETAAEVQEAKEGANRPAAPYEGDPKEAHAFAAMQAQVVPSVAFNTTDMRAPGQFEGEKEKLYSIRLLYDWWDGQGIRHPRDTSVDVPFNEAKKLLSEGKAERADEFTARD